MPQRRPRIDTGVSIPELCVAVFILGLFIVPIFNAFRQSTTIVKIGKHDHEVMCLGASFSAQARKLNPGVLPDSGAVVEIPPPADGIVNLGGPETIELPAWDARIFTVSYEVKPFSQLAFPPTLSGLPRLAKLVTLSVVWEEQIGGKKAASFPVLLLPW